MIEKGNLEVTIKGRVVRTMGRGDVVGELALLYDSPRAATVRTVRNKLYIYVDNIYILPCAFLKE